MERTHLPFLGTTLDRLLRPPPTKPVGTEVGQEGDTEDLIYGDFDSDMTKPRKPAEPGNILEAALMLLTNQTQQEGGISKEAKDVRETKENLVKEIKEEEKEGPERHRSRSVSRTNRVE